MTVRQIAVSASASTLILPRERLAMVTELLKMLVYDKLRFFITGSR
jgi:hypothetical protein